MKCLISSYSNATVGVTTISRRELALMTGEGNGQDEAWVLEQIDKRTNPARGPVWPLAVVEPHIRALANGGLTEAQALAVLHRVADATVERDQGLVCIQREVTEYETLPGHVVGPSADDRYFRNACEWVAGACSVNLPKARLIHMGRIRLVRDKELALLDPLLMRAEEQGNVAEADRIKALKQRLRDIPQTFDLSGHTTPETLKAAWPAELPPRQPL